MFVKDSAQYSKNPTSWLSLYIIAKDTQRAFRRLRTKSDIENGKQAPVTYWLPQSEPEADSLRFGSEHRH